MRDERWINGTHDCTTFLDHVSLEKCQSEERYCDEGQSFEQISANNGDITGDKQLRRYALANLNDGRSIVGQIHCQLHLSAIKSEQIH